MWKLFFMQKNCQQVTTSKPYLENILHKITITSKLTGLEQSWKYISSAFLQICAKLHLLMSTKKKALKITKCFCYKGHLELFYIRYDMEYDAMMAKTSNLKTNWCCHLTGQMGVKTLKLNHYSFFYFLKNMFQNNQLKKTEFTGKQITSLLLRKGLLGTKL